VEFLREEEAGGDEHRAERKKLEPTREP